MRIGGSPLRNHLSQRIEALLRVEQHSALGLSNLDLEMIRVDLDLAVPQEPSSAASLSQSVIDLFQLIRTRMEQATRLPWIRGAV